MTSMATDTFFFCKIVIYDWISIFMHEKANPLLLFFVIYLPKLFFFMTIFIDLLYILNHIHNKNI